ncbi:putative replication factor C small subunit [Dictyocaulus viviparus]|uniref:Putative replication factor C small subunit n=1 Tax=Dictyocaulus viviparus TaxID=29172 RepID=A0A0D8XF74_DICVI|nr:putative replication factor C small subunit [Dictyocaulus viviparus]
MNSLMNGTEQEQTLNDEDSSVPWVEKYRPRRVDDLVYQREIVDVLKKVLEGAELPNILLYGPPGTGKTSTAVAFCRQLFPVYKLYRDRVLELNASDERGIHVVRTRIKEFAHRAVPKGGTPLKIIILDEADAMTNAAQAALRRIIEKNSKTTRFILICNYISRIIDPLTSRCAKFRFKPLPMESQMERLRYICENEGVNISEDSLAMLISFCEGDLRRSINYLQSLAFRHNITTDFIISTTGQIIEKDIRQLVLACHSSDTNRLLDASDYLRRCGYAGRIVIARLFDQLVDDDTLKEIEKSAIFEKMAVIEGRLLDGSDEYIQIMDLLFVIQSYFSHS